MQRRRAAQRGRFWGRLGANAALIGLSLGSSLACGGSNAAIEARVGKLQDELVKLQNDRDRMEERLSVIEVRQTVTPRARSTGTSSSRPPLQVVTLVPEGANSEIATEPVGASPANSDRRSPVSSASPEGSSARADEGDGEVRPLIRAYGNRILSSGVSNEP
jgi:hypothetical protein